MWKKFCHLIVKSCRIAPYFTSIFNVYAWKPLKILESEIRRDMEDLVDVSNLIWGDCLFSLKTVDCVYNMVLFAELNVLCSGSTTSGVVRIF